MLERLRDPERRDRVRGLAPEKPCRVLLRQQRQLFLAIPLLQHLYASIHVEGVLRAAVEVGRQVVENALGQHSHDPSPRPVSVLS